MANSGTVGMAPFLMDLVTQDTNEDRLRLGAATALYGMIARAWTVDVRKICYQRSKEESRRTPL